MVPDGDWGSSNRKDDFLFQLVDPFTLAETGEYVDFEYGSSSITLGYYTTNYYSASLVTRDPVPMTRLVRILHTVALDDGTSAEEIMGTFFVKEATKNAEHGKIDYQIPCNSTWLRFSDDKAAKGSYEQAGYNITNYLINDIIGTRGGLVKRCDDGTDLILGANCAHGIDDTVSTVIDDLVAACNKKATVDDLGYVVISDIPDHASMDPEYTFIEGETCTYKAGYKETDSNTDKVNRVVYTMSYEDSTGTERSIAAEAVLDATDPFSFENIGRFVTRNEQGEMDRCSSTQEYYNTRTDMQRQAKVILDENSGSIQYYEIEHVGIPGLRHGSVVRYINYTDGENPIDVKCLITEMQITLGAGCWTKTKLKVIA